MQSFTIFAYIICACQMTAVTMATKDNNRPLTVNWLLESAKNISRSDAHANQKCNQDNTQLNMTNDCQFRCNCQSDCTESRMCCIDAYDKIEGLENLQSQQAESRYQCINPLLNDKLSKSNLYMYLHLLSHRVSLISRCPENILRTNQQTAQLCLVDYSTIWTYFGMENGFPVMETKWPFRHFKNVFCAQCHGIVDDDDFIRWDAVYESMLGNDFWQDYDRQNHVQSLNKFTTYVPEERNIRFVPPNGTDINDLICGIDTCNVSGEWKRHDPDIERACLSFRNLYWLDVWFRNIFCVKCNYDVDIVCTGVRVDDYVSYLSLFDHTFLLEAKPTATDHSRQQCKPGQFYDNIKERCLEIQCSEIMFYNGETCQPAMPRTNGQQVRISIDYKVDPHQMLFSEEFVMKMEVAFMLKLEQLINDTTVDAGKPHLKVYVDELTFNYDVNVLYEYHTLNVEMTEVFVIYVYADIFLFIENEVDRDFFDTIPVLKTVNRFYEAEYVTDQAFTRVWKLSKARSLYSIHCDVIEYFTHSIVKMNIMDVYFHFSTYIFTSSNYPNFQRSSHERYLYFNENDFCFFTGQSEYPLDSPPTNFDTSSVNYETTSSDSSMTPSDKLATSTINFPLIRPELTSTPETSTFAKFISTDSSFASTHSTNSPNTSTTPKSSVSTLTSTTPKSSVSTLTSTSPKSSVSTFTSITPPTPTNPSFTSADLSSSSAHSQSTLKNPASYFTTTGTISQTTLQDINFKSSTTETTLEEEARTDNDDQEVKDEQKIVPLLTKFSLSFSPDRPLFIQFDRLLFCQRIQFDQSDYIETETGVSIPYLNLSISNKDVKYGEDDNSIQVCLELVQNALNGNRNTSNQNLKTKDKPMSSKMLTKVILTFTIVGLSILSLLLTLVIYILQRSLRTMPGLLIMYLSFSLLLHQLLYILPVMINLTNLVCKIVGIGNHFFVVSYFFWMNINSFHLMNLLDTSRQRFIKLRVITVTRVIGYTCYVFGSSAACVAINIIYSVTITDTAEVGYGGPMCYIKQGMMIGFTVTLPLGMILVANLVMFIRTIISLRRTNFATESFNKRYFFTLCKLSTLTGLTWCLAFLAQWTDVEVFEYIFIVLNGGQGLVIFLAFVANKRVLRLFTPKSCTRVGSE